MTSSTNLILASVSPRRQELLSGVGVDFTVSAADVDETAAKGESPIDYVSRVAIAKGVAVYSPELSNVAVLSADTIVTADSQIFGKPNDKQHAIAMWEQLSDREHQVVTAVCLHHACSSELRIVRTTVRFTKINLSQMLRYWQTSEPRDKAGAYAIQGFAAAWVESIHGSYSNVVGLPLFETNTLLTSIGHNWL